MWELLEKVITETGKIFNDVSFYLILGLFLAGVIKHFIPSELLTRHLGSRSFSSVFKASLIGIPLPLCSCSVLPTAVALKKQGASNGATVSFLISTPETGVDSISVTYALLDAIFTIFRPIAAFITAFTAGTAVNLLEGVDENNQAKESVSKKPLKKKHEEIKRSLYSFSKRIKEFFTFKGIRSSFEYGYKEILSEILKWLLIGFLLAGAISAILPNDFFIKYLNDPLLSMIVMVIIGVPIYICAVGSTPIAAAMILKGLNPGAALVFLLVGPATNIGSFFILSKYIKKKYLIVYLISLILISILLGLILNLFYGPGNSPVRSVAGGEEVAGLPGWIKLISSILLLVLIIKSAYDQKMHTNIGQFFSRNIRKFGFNPAIVVKASIFLLIFLYLISGFYTVNIGETCIVVRFGKVISVNNTPGLYYEIPYPFTSIKTQQHEYINELQIGFRITSDSALLMLQPQEEFIESDVATMADIPSEGTDVPEEGLIFTGDENIIDVDLIAHYKIKDPYKYLYNLRTGSDIVRCCILSSMRRVFNRTDIMSILVSRRYELTGEIEEETTKLLNELDVGVELLNIYFTNIHAPADVHYYFRDVASSMEDKQKLINKAQKYYQETTIKARGESVVATNQASAYSMEKINKAEGEAQAFISRYFAYALHPAINRFRLYIDTIEIGLARVKSIFFLKFKNLSPADLWLNLSDRPVFLPYEKTSRPNER